MKLKHWYCYLTYLFIASLILTGVAFSRFSTTIDNTGAENAGSPAPGPGTPDIGFSVWALDQGAATVSLENLRPGNTKTIGIWVRNSDGAGTVSGYDQEVTLELRTTGNLPLAYTLQREGGISVALSHPDPYRYVSEIQSFTAGAEETKAFVLTVSWPVGSNQVRYRDEIDYLELRLTAVQA